MGWITIDAEDKAGNQKEVLVSSTDPPEIGAWFDEEGETLRRILTKPPRARVKKYECIGHSLPRRDAAREGGFAMAKNYDSRGRAVFTSRAEVDDYLAKHNDNPNNGTKLEWDPDGGIE